MLKQVFQKHFERQGLMRVAGVDEVGRGPLAGPVVAAAVVLPAGLRGKKWLARVRDSKTVAKAEREELAARIEESCAVGIGACDVDEIVTWNIRGAALRAMAKAVAQLPEPAEALLVDGRDVVPPALLERPLMQRAIIKGDGVELAVACASLVAKVHRDRLMAALAEEFPAYGWERNAGYGTAVHLAALQQYGITEHHRVEFSPIKMLLAAKTV